MHTVMDSTGSTVPAFITKLWRLVEDHNYDHLIQWNSNGKSFIITDQSKFAKELLPLYFKHSNMSSFIRQLNMYGFRKVSNIENSGLRSEQDDIEFFNQHFIRGQESELLLIKRKSSPQIPMTVKAGQSPAHFKQEDVSDILQDMESIKGKQSSVDGLLTNMQRENEALWREVAILRQKHHKQQQIVEKLIQFLVSLVQNRGVLGIKRKQQLMIDSADEIQKMNKKMRTDFSSRLVNKTSSNPRSTGPIIHDITDGENEAIITAAASPLMASQELSPNPEELPVDVFDLVSSSSANQIPVDSKPIESLNLLDPLQESIKELGLIPDETQTPGVVLDPNTANADNPLRSSLNTPPGSPSQQAFDESNPNLNLVKDLVVSNQNNSSLTPSVLTDHVEGIEAELDWLQDQLSSGISIDTNTLLGVRSDSVLPINIWLKELFSMDENNVLSGLSTNNLDLNRNSDIIGNEVIQFNPNSNYLFDDFDLEGITGDDQSPDPLLDEELLPNLPNIATEGTVSFPPEADFDCEKPLKTEIFP